MNYESVGRDYKNTGDIPTGENIFYRCENCGSIIPSLPKDNIRFECRHIMIDWDYGRLVVVHFDKFEVLKTH